MVEEDGDHLAATPLIGKIQSALALSLTDLSKLQEGSVPLAPVFGAPDSSEQASDIFVLMPFLEALRPVYEEHIKPAGESMNMTVSRGDDFFTASSIIDDIWQAIYNSQIIIADCTGRNPNVFYEIGIAHTVGKPTILISQSIDDVPFDLRHRRCIVYQFTPRGMSAFTEALAQTLEVETARNIRGRFP